MTEYTIGRMEDKAEIVDFINYVFSQQHCPHDFKLLQPVCYADSVSEMRADHYLAKEDGKIRGLIACRKIKADFCGKTLKIGEIGNVSVHPYSRGSGYMKTLLHSAIEDCRAQGVDYMILGGLRQRYAYFGFEHGGYRLVFDLNENNFSHALSKLDSSPITFTEMTEDTPDAIRQALALYRTRPYHVERKENEFLPLLRGGHRRAYSVLRDGKWIGYISGEGLTECVLAEEKDFPLVLCAAHDTFGVGNFTLTCAPFEQERIAFLRSVCENFRVTHVEQILVLNWKNVLEGMLRLKASFMRLDDGEAVFSVDGKGYRITVSDHVPTVTEAEVPAGAPAYTNTEAELRFLQLDALTLPDPYYHNWLPLPFSLDAPDGF